MGYSDTRNGSPSFLVDASPDAVVVIDETGAIRHCTRAVEDLFGYSPDELVGQPVEVLIPEAVRDAHVANRTHYMTGATSRPMGLGLELYGRRRDGSTLPVDIALAPVGSSGGLQVAAFVRDASERRRTQALLADVNRISLQLLAGRPVPEILSLVAARARALVGAACAWVVVPTGDGRLAVAASDADRQIDLVGATLAASGSHSGRAMATGTTIAILNLSDDPVVLAEARELGLGPGLYLPLVAEQGPIGALVVARSDGQPQFTSVETVAAQLFASAAGVVLALGRARSELEALQLTSDHERIARDLHDTVIQRLFAIGMGLQSVQRRAVSPVAERIESAVDSLDSVIRDIRETIFDLSRPPAVEDDLRQRVAVITRDGADQLGFQPTVTYRGPVETGWDEEATGHLLAVLREALSNTARHAKASAVSVTISVDEAFAVLKVVDDGVGLADNRTDGHGLGNMTERAQQLGGRLEIRPAEGPGTVLEWRIPVRNG